MISSRIKLVVALFIAGLAALGFSQVKLSVKAGTMDVGTCEFSYSLLPGGGVKQSMLIRASLGGQKATNLTEYVYTKTGRPISTTERTTANGVERSSYKETYGASSIAVVHSANGKTERRTIAIPKGATLDSPSNFWFVNTKPKKGQVDKHADYRRSSQKWEDEAVTYVGDKSFKVGAKTVVGHELRHELGSMWVDDKGYPIRIELKEGGNVLVMERM